jgi:hypothetical protein
LNAAVREVEAFGGEGAPLAWSRMIFSEVGFWANIDSTGLTDGSGIRAGAVKTIERY